MLDTNTQRKGAGASAAGAKGAGQVGRASGLSQGGAKAAKPGAGGKMAALPTEDVPEKQFKGIANNALN